jgi:D-tyrosyl-tRNA(Tyr) deacylase
MEPPRVVPLCIDQMQRRCRPRSARAHDFDKRAPPDDDARVRAVVQRVSRAEVRVAGEVLGRIGRGFVALVGAGQDDGDDDVAYIADKIAGLRVFPDEAGLMNRALAEVDGAVLVVSQFTLHGDCRKGRRPSFVAALAPGPAEVLYEKLLARLREAGLRVESGRFRAMMEVDLVNDGPVTLLLDSKRLF